MKSHQAQTVNGNMNIIDQLPMTLPIPLTKKSNRKVMKIQRRKIRQEGEGN